jgi:hypothetical protein
MLDARAKAITSVDSIIAQLDALGDPGAKWREDNGGWTTEARERSLKSFREIRARLLSGDTEFQGLGHHLIRWLDHGGVIGGPVLAEAARLQGLLRELWRGST